MPAAFLNVSSRLGEVRLLRPAALIALLLRQVVVLDAVRVLPAAVFPAIAVAAALAAVVVHAEWWRYVTSIFLTACGFYSRKLFFYILLIFNILSKESYHEANDFQLSGRYFPNLYHS